jgi:alpha-1,2-mannosyltransferase
VERAPDFSDFYLAADAVLAGNSPDEIDLPAGWLGYVYPPLLAWLMTPLTLLPVHVAVSLWAVVSVLFVVAALWILGVRDWRCYPVALLWPFHREVIEFGTVDSLLVFVVALCWRYRDASGRASLATGFVVSLKLFLWPLALWLGLGGRLRAAALSVVTGALFVVVPWALIDFQDVTRYPGLVREVSQQQGGTYSLASFGETLGLAANFATVLSTGVGAGLLYLAYRAAREPLDSAAARDRRSLTLTIAAALALTPVVWNHYLVLLLIPVALARPRLSGLWLAPIALNALYVVHDYGPSPDGRLVPLTAVTGVAVATIVLALQPGSGRATAVPSRARSRVRRAAVPALAVGAMLATLFVLVPEKLNDRPYNPLGRDTSHTSQQTRSSG